eukprot:COSAG01_NODE_18479_length_1073_cov_1.290554_2_plen_227_part_01
MLTPFSCCTVSDPASASYGEFLTTAEIMELTAPKPEDMSAVTSFLGNNGIAYQTRHSNVIAAMDVATASALFSTTFHVAINDKHSQAIIRAADYELPDEIENSVQSVFGMHGLPLPPKELKYESHGMTMHKLQGDHGDAALPPTNVTPDVLNRIYGISSARPSGSIINRQAVAAFQGQFMNSSDLAKLFSRYVDKYVEGTDDVVYKWVGVHKENSSGVEAELDIQYI